MSCDKTRAFGQGGGCAAWLRLAGFVTCLSISAATWAVDPADIVVHTDSGQSAEEARRDRFECHNWAVQQTGEAPARGSDAGDRGRRGERIGKVLAGAAIGAAAGSVIRGARDHRDAGDGALAGGVLGAIAGAVIGEKDDAETDEIVDEYYRALDACMTGRGYSLSVADR